MCEAPEGDNYVFTDLILMREEIRGGLETQTGGTPLGGRLVQRSSLTMTSALTSLPKE